MFREIKNSALDSAGQISIRQQVFAAYAEEGITSQADPIQVVRNYRDAAKGQAAQVDRVLSKLLTGSDLLEYAGRMKYVWSNIRKLDREIAAAEARPSRWLNVVVRWPISKAN